MIDSTEEKLVFLETKVKKYLLFWEVFVSKKWIFSCWKMPQSGLTGLACVSRDEIVHVQASVDKS